MCAVRGVGGGPSVVLWQHTVVNRFMLVEAPEMSSATYAPGSMMAAFESIVATYL